MREMNNLAHFCFKEFAQFVFVDLGHEVFLERQVMFFVCGNGCVVKLVWLSCTYKRSGNIMRPSYVSLEHRVEIGGPDGNRGYKTLSIFAGTFPQQLPIPLAQRFQLRTKKKHIMNYFPILQLLKKPFCIAIGCIG